MWEPTLFNRSLTELNLVSMLLRLGMASLCGSLLGIERIRRGRSAGMRTYALVCAGAALVMMTSQFINQTFETATDPGRMGAQVISGIGFLCAGTILLTGHHRIMGLTTAAALWASACIGLAIGVGFYAGGLAMFLIMMAFMTLFSGYRDRIGVRTHEMQLYVILESKEAAAALLTLLRQGGYTVDSLMDAVSNAVAGVAVTFQLTRGSGLVNHSEALRLIRSADGVLYTEEST